MAISTLYDTKQKKALEADISLTQDERQKQVERLKKKKNYEPSQDDEKKLAFLANRFRIMDNSRPIIRDGDLRYKQFLSRLFYRKDGLANVNLPIEFATIENKLADELVQVPIVDLLPQTRSDVHKVSMMKRIWDFVWNEADTGEEIVHHKLCKNIFGTSGWFEGLHRDVMTRYEPVIQEDGKIEMKPIQETRSYLKGMALDIRDWWIDPVYSINVAEDCFIRERDVSFDAVLQLIHDPNYNKDAILEYLATKNGQGDMNTNTRNSYEVFRTEQEIFNVENEKLALMHYYNKRLGLYIVTDQDFKFVFRCGANPYPHGELPISVEVDHTNYRSIYGRGECELLESTKYERNMIRNQFLDSVRFSNTINIAIGGGLTFEDQEMIGGVARIWNFQGDLGQMQFLKPPQADSGLAQVEEMLSRDATWITGIDNNSLLGSPEKTAYQSRLQEQQKQKRVFMSLRNADFFYTRMGRQRLANIRAFLPYTTGRRIVGEEMEEMMNGKYRVLPLNDTQAEPIMGVDEETGQVVEKGLKMKPKKGYTEFLECTPKMIKNSLDIRVTTPSTTPILRDLNRAEMQELMNMALAFAGFPQGKEFLTKLKLEEIWEEQVKGLGYDPDEYMQDEEELTPEKEQEDDAAILGSVPSPFQLSSTPEEAPQANPIQPSPMARGGQDMMGQMMEQGGFSAM